MKNTPLFDGLEKCPFGQGCAYVMWVLGKALDGLIPPASTLRHFRAFQGGRGEGSDVPFKSVNSEN